MEARPGSAHTRGMKRVSFGVFFLFTLGIAAGAALAQELDIPEQACPDWRMELVPRTDGSRGMGLRVVNVDAGDFDVHLQRDITVEREVNGRWQRVSVAGLELRERCAGTTPDCVTIGRDSAITIVPWTGMQGDGQCVCTRCADAPAGRYRFSVSSCHCQHPRTTYSATFELGPSR